MLHPTFLISAPGGSEWILLLLLFIPVVCLYFLPTILANSRKKSNTGGIFVLNLLLGWTFLGWVISLVFALMGENKSSNPTVVVNNASQAYSQEYKPEQPQAKGQNQPVVAGSKLLSPQDKIDQLRQLKQLLDEGVLTADEFNAQKAVILG